MPFSPEENVPLAPLTTWKIGGPAEWYAAPTNDTELHEAISWAKDRSLPVHIIGRGSNLLIADTKIQGLTLSLRSFNPTIEETSPDLSEPTPIKKSESRSAISEAPCEKKTTFLEAGAGLALPRLSKAIAQLGYTGYEFYIGIPGTVGGGVAMNAGFGPSDERQTANRCTEVQVLTPEGETKWHPYSHYHPVYRHTDLLDGRDIVLRARFALRHKSSPEDIRAVTAEHLAMRKSKQPLTRPTAGSVFKGTNEGVPAAVYIDRCGLKGHRIGGAMVSLKHANWIENMGGATAEDVRQLIEHIRELVAREEDVDLEPEVRFLR